MAEVLFEVRDHRYRQDLWDACLEWADEAAVILRDRFDIVGSGFDAGRPGHLHGSAPVDHPLGPPNVNWIIRWESMEHRDRGWDALLSDPEWTDLWSRHPDADGYLTVAVRFMEGG
jgi:hypothetical protein